MGSPCTADDGMGETQLYPDPHIELSMICAKLDGLPCTADDEMGGTQLYPDPHTELAMICAQLDGLNLYC